MSLCNGHVIPVDILCLFYLFGAVKVIGCFYLIHFNLLFISSVHIFIYCSNFLSRLAPYTFTFCFPPRDQTCLITLSCFVDKHLSYNFISLIQIQLFFSLCISHRK